MHLWNDYEGKTIAEAYPLEKLIRPEGRTAFFTTKNGSGIPNIIRLTESLNDEHEMIECWRQVASVHQENLITIKKYGQTTFDGVPLAYALMENTDANLADILKERPLTQPETKEIAASVVAALSALHAIDLVHQHIEPASVFASGEIIKLRSDCVRECTQDPNAAPEFNSPGLCAELKKRDIHDLGVLLLQCLTLESVQAPGTRLPAPFDRIIPNCLNGILSLADLEKLLNPTAPSVPASKPVAPAAAQPSNGTGRMASEASKQASKEAPVEGRAQFKPEVAPVESAPVQPKSDGKLVTDALPPHRAPAAGTSLPVSRIDTRTSTRSRYLGPAMGVAAVLIVLLVWLFLPSRTPAPTQTAAPITSSVATPSASAPSVTAPSSSSPAAATQESSAPTVSAAAVPPAKPSAATSSAVTTSTRAGWHVVAYTYNHSEQAEAKARSLHAEHPGLNPQVFSPNGRAPYLVTVGGIMTRSEAVAERQRAVRSGLPRDTFARNYQAH